MGCDIHFHIEVKLEGEWRHYSHIWLPSNYSIFAKLAGVRNYDEVTPVSEPKGLPVDATYMTIFDSKRDNYHDFSWLNMDEIDEFEAWWAGRYDNKWIECELYHCYLFGNTFTGWRKYKDNYNKIEDVRFVFWFDN